MRPRPQGRAPAVRPADGASARAAVDTGGRAAAARRPAGAGRLHGVAQGRQCRRPKPCQAPAARGRSSRHAGPCGGRPRLRAHRPDGRADMRLCRARGGSRSRHGGAGERAEISLGRGIGTAIATAIDRALSLPLVGLVLIYRYLLSPFMPHTCRYGPTCSAYAIEALRLHGAVRGGWLAARRILGCHPWGGSGYDPVPAPFAFARRAHHPARRSHSQDASEPIGPPL